MEPMAALMHALSEPDEYVFEWRDGEIFIEPKVVAAVAKAPALKVYRAESSRQSSAPRQPQSAYASA